MASGYTIVGPRLADQLDLEGRAKAYVLKYMEAGSKAAAYRHVFGDSSENNAYAYHSSEHVQKALYNYLSKESIVQRVDDLFHESQAIEDTKDRVDTQLKCVDRLMVCKGISKATDANVSINTQVVLSKEDRERIIGNITSNIPLV